MPSILNPDMDLPNIFGALTQGEMFAVVKSDADPAASSPSSGFMNMARADQNTHYPFTDRNAR